MAIKTRSVRGEYFHGALLEMGKQRCSARGVSSPSAMQTYVIAWGDVDRVLFLGFYVFLFWISDITLPLFAGWVRNASPST